MRLERCLTTLDNEPAAGVKLIGAVSYDGVPGPPERIWFHYPPECEADVDPASGNPWLACLLPVAVTRGEPLRLELPVDPALLEGAHRVMEVWHGWYPDLRPVPIEAPAAAAARAAPTGAVGAFFSGGIDSFYSLLHRPGLDRADDTAGDVREMVCVAGFDVRLRDPAECARLHRLHRSVAQHLGIGGLDVTTNLRDTRFAEADWPRLSHGAALAAVALGVESRFGTIRIASSAAPAQLIPWGSHPDTDPWLSTGRLRIDHHGLEQRRVHKTEFLARSPLVQAHLRVCHKTGGIANCSNCNKCYRTMAALEALGVLDRFGTFDARRFATRRLARVLSKHQLERNYLAEVPGLARTHGRMDIAEAIEASFAHSDRVLLRLERSRRVRALGLRPVGRILKKLALRSSVR